jgi:hypothetical protein
MRNRRTAANSGIPLTIMFMNDIGRAPGLHLPSHAACLGFEAHPLLPADSSLNRHSSSFPLNQTKQMGMLRASWLARCDCPIENITIAIDFFTSAARSCHLYPDRPTKWNFRFVSFIYVSLDRRARAERYQFLVRLHVHSLIRKARP